jgi:hypothetical protein
LRGRDLTPPPDTVSHFWCLAAFCFGP